MKLPNFGIKSICIENLKMEFEDITNVYLSKNLLHAHRCFCDGAAIIHLNAKLLILNPI
jgi:hypothetical protein